MKPLDPRTFDLNLVRVFLAIWEMRSVTGAADRLGLTQPAVSHALKRLRESFDDPLFLRVGTRMKPTEAARRLHEPFGQALRVISATMRSQASFDPGQSDRVFRLALSDFSEFYILPQILAHLDDGAPGIRIETLPLEAATVASDLRTGRADLALGYLPDLQAPDFQSSWLLRDRFLCLMAADNPVAAQPLTVQSMAGLSFVDVAFHATGYKRIEAALEQLGVTRRTMVRIEHFNAAPEIVRRSRLATIFSACGAERLAQPEDFAALPLPYDLPEIDIHLHMHALFENDPGILWLRDTLVDALRDGDAFGL